MSPAGHGMTAFADAFRPIPLLLKVILINVLLLPARSTQWIYLLGRMSEFITLPEFVHGEIVDTVELVLYAYCSTVL